MKRDTRIAGFHDPDSAVPLDDPESTCQVEWNKNGQIERIEWCEKEGTESTLEEILESVVSNLNSFVFNDRPFKWKGT